MKVELYESYKNVEKNHWWFVGRRKMIFDLFKKYGFLSNSHKVLDFGCYSGFLVKLLQEQGYDASGCDISSDAIVFGREQGTNSLSVLQGESIPFADQSFDVILALDVIEHIKDDYGAMAELKRVLKPGGTIIIMVPALQILWGIQDEAAHHFRRYNRETLTKLVSQSGFKILRMSYFNSILFLPILFVRLIQRFIRPKRVSDFELNNKFLNWCFKIVFLLETYILQYINFSVGVSLLTVIKKNEA